MASRFRSWTWTRIDGRNVLAMPTRDEVHLYDSEDFILLDKIAPTGHRSYIHAVRWSAFHGKLASLSRTQLVVHAPQLTATHSENGSGEVASERVRFVRICDFDLAGALTDLRGIAFSRCADLLLFGGPSTIGIIDIRATAQLRNAEDLRLSSFGNADKKIVWSQPIGGSGVDVVKFSPCSFIFAAFAKGASVIHVWRTVRDPTSAHDLGRRVVHIDSLEHPEPVAYASWKPATTQMHAAVEYDGARKARWFEPQRMVLTCTKVSRTVRVWIESEAETGKPRFTPALEFEPTLPLHNVRWVLSKNRNISEEKFQIVDTADEQQVDWMSGVDDTGVLHLYQLLGVASKSPRVRDTELRVKVNGEEGSEDVLRHSVDCEETIKKLIELEEICVMAYFSQNYFGLPSKLDIVLQRSDGIILSYIIAIGKKKQVQVKKKSWYRNHLGSIAALAAHPSLPLIASVDEHRSDHNDVKSTLGNEILIFWVSFSAFSAESRLIPSGVLECAPENGPVLCVQWIPTLHFDATPLFLVAYASGTIDIYGRSANARDVVSSPRASKKSKSPRSHRLRQRSPSLSPWTFFDYTTGQSGIEFEVAVQKDDRGLGFEVDFEDGVPRVRKVIHADHSQISPGDEIVAINSELLANKDLIDFQRMLDAVSVGSIALLRFRAQVEDGAELINMPPNSTTQVLHEESDDGCDSEHLDGAVHSEDVLSSAHSGFSLNASYVHAGSVSMYGGWRQLLSAKVTNCLQLVCVCPVYADDGEYIAGTVLIFGVCGTLPGSLSVWKGQYSSSGGHTFSLLPLHIADSAVLKKDDVTSIAGERDYRQRAFTSTKRNENSTQLLNSLVFVGDASGSVHHWRCRISDSSISFATMSTCTPEDPGASSRISGSVEFSLNSFFRRGYYNSRRGSGIQPSEEGRVVGIHHIEVDDPNRIAVLHASRPDALHIFEGESGLGMMRLEETITAEGRGHILGFCWCNAHVEFNIDALAVQYESGIVIYQYDMNTHGWAQVGKDVPTKLAAFDCTRDSSALLIGGGHISRGSFQEDTEEIPIVLGKWDEPGNLLQDAMDWKAPESPQKLPVWHPYVVVTTLFGMHARVGVKDTTMASDTPAFEFSKAFKDAVQMLKLLTKVLEDDASTRLSAGSGVLAYSIPHNTREGKSLSLKAAATAIMFIGQGGSRHDSIGRYSTAIHTNASLNKAENLFADPMFRRRENGNSMTATSTFFGSRLSTDKLDKEEAAVLLRAIDEVIQVKGNLKKPSNASIMFGSFQREHLLEFKAVLHFVDVMQSLGFELDASAADLGAKRYYAMFLFGRSMHAVLRDYTVKPNPTANDDARDGVERSAMEAYLKEAPSSGLLWALHSNAQAFLLEHCVSSQPTWEELRPMWMALWVRDIKDLRAIAERLAKSVYMKTRDAMGVVLFYVALGKKNILGALAKMSKIETNQNLAIFLENDFSQERWTNAAVKNAYSLLSKKQYEAAAGFFLLCEPPRLQEALRLLAVRLEDPSLALLIARLVEHRTSDSFSFDFISSSSSGGQKEITPAGPATRRLLEHDLIPVFRERRDRWLESAALWWLEDFEQACTILLPQSQPIDMDLGKPWHNHDTFVPDTIMRDDPQLDVIKCSRSVTYFFVNLTSIPIYFQFLYTSGIDAPLVTWAIKKLLTERDSSGSGPRSSEIAAVVGIAARKHKLATTADIEHAYSFAAYVCKRSGMSDTSVVEMLQARHLVNLHAKQELRLQSNNTGRVDAITTSTHPVQDEEQHSLPTSPRMVSILQDWRKTQSPMNLLGRQSSFNGERQSPRWRASPRRMSELNDMMDHVGPSSMVTGMKTLLQRSNTVHWSLSADDSSSPTVSSPWLKAQVADIECRRWSSSAFVGKMLGIRVAREMITHFRAEFDICFRHFVEGMPLRTHRHRDFLEELCAPLCTQFQVDQTYVLEAALSVLQPHAYLHIAEICFLLAVLGRSATLTKWIQYVALSMLKSCGTFASCEITDTIYRDWESLTIQLCYVLQLDSQGQIDIPHHVVAQVAVAVRTGCVFLSWCKQQWNVVRQAITNPFYSRVGGPKSNEDVSAFFADLSQFSFQQNLGLIRELQNRESELDEGFAWNGNGFGYLFLRTVAAHLQGDESSIFDSSSQPEREIEDSETESNNQQPQLHRMYSLILMVSVLRTLYARGQVFLLSCRASGEDGVDPAYELEELDISSSLFTPHKQWKALTENPLDGLRRWYSLIESHLRCEFDYSVKEVTCICGLYGLDGRSADLAAKVQERITKFEDSLALRGSLNEDDSPSQHYPHVHFGFHHHAKVPLRKDDESGAMETRQCQYRLEEFLDAIGIEPSLHRRLLRTSDDYILLLMRHPKYGIPLSIRRFRLEPRVHVRCFLLKDAFRWFISTTGIFRTMGEARHFLSRCCKQRKIRLLVKHRGQDAHHFPAHHGHKDDDEIIDGENALEEGSTHSTADSELQTDEETIRTLAYQAMMFVDPWEVEAEGNAWRYMHGMKIPLHVELGWDRLSPICTAVVDDIAKTVFRGDSALCEMWQSTRGEGWLITSIIQYQLDGVHSHRSGHVETKCVFEEDNKVPFLVEVHSRSQRNALFQEVGLPHRFVGVVKVKLISGKLLIPVKWIEYFNDPYVFFNLSTSDSVDLGYNTWSVQTYRSRCAPGGTNPVWNHPEEDEFSFRFAIPTHKPHFEATTPKCHDPQCKVADNGIEKAPRDEDGTQDATAERIWNSATTSMAQNARDQQSVEVLEALFQHSFTGPPLFLHCAVFHKTKLFAHHFMGRGKVALTPLTSGHPMDVWIPLEGVESGSLHVQVSLSFQLMCSSVAPHSANSYHRPMYDFVSEQSTSISEPKYRDNPAVTPVAETHSGDATADVDAPLLVDQVPPLPPHLMPHVPRSTGSRF